MFDASLMGKLERIEVPTDKRYKKRCYIDKNKSVFNISASVSAELDWADVERVDLYRIGSTFVLKPEKVGLIKVCMNNNTAQSRRITNKNFCLEIMSRCRSAREFEAWVEGENPKMLFFKPKEGEK